MGVSRVMILGSSIYETLLKRLACPIVYVQSNVMIFSACHF